MEGDGFDVAGKSIKIFNVALKYLTMITSVESL